MKAIKNLKIYHQSVLFLIFILSFTAAWYIPKIQFSYDFEDFFPNENEELLRYEKYRKTFEYDNEFVLVSIENKEGIFRKKFLTQIDSLTNRLANLQLIKEVTSPGNLRYTDLSGLFPIQKKVLHINNEALYKDDSSFIYSTPYFIGSYFPQNAKSVSLFIKTKDVLTKKQSDQLAKEIIDAINHFEFDASHYVGRIFAQGVYLESLQYEFELFIVLAFVVVILFLWISFKSFYAILTSIAIVLISIIWTVGMMGILEQPLNIMTIMLPTMIFIAGISNVIHFLAMYFDELKKETPRETIYSKVLKTVGIPTFITLITTVVGFLSLLLSNLKPIREFGLFTAIGVSLSFILTYTFLPAVLYLIPPKKTIDSFSKQNKTVFFGKLFLFVLRNKKLIYSGFLVALIASPFAISKIRVNNILLEDLSEKVKIKQDFNFFDTYYSGARPLEIELRMKNNYSVYDYETLLQIHQLDQFIKKNYKAGFILSPSGLVNAIYHNSYQAHPDSFPGRSETLEIVTYLKQNKKNKQFARIISEDGRLTRISGKIKDIGSLKVKELNKQLLENFIHHGDTARMQLYITGAAHLVDRNNDYMVSSMIKGFILSVIIITLLTFLIHKNLKMVFIFLIPNLSPLLFVGMIMSLLGIELKAATSLVFSIAFGIATDDTIHFISRLKLELDKGKSLLYALKRTFYETGKPIVLTSFILMGGFITLMLSDFTSIFYFGSLICLVVVIALISDLLLLPLLILWLKR